MCKKSMKLVMGTSLHHPSRENLSRGFILKMTLPWEGIQMHSLEVYKLQIFYFAQRLSYEQR